MTEIFWHVMHGLTTLALALACIGWYYARLEAKMADDDAKWWKARAQSWADRMEERTDTLVALNEKIRKAREILA